MASSEETVVLRLQAVNEADAALGKANQNINELQKSLEEANKRTKELAAANNRMWVGSAQEARKTFDTLQKGYSARDMAETRARQAQEAYAQALSKVKVHTNEVSAELASMVGRYASVATVIETVRRGFVGFAEDTRALNRIQGDTGATTHQVKELNEAIEALSAVTGQSFGELSKGFRTFQQESGLAVDQARKTYEQVAVAAHAAGTSTQALAKATVAAMGQMNVPVQEVQGVLDTWVKTVPSGMMGAWAEAAPRILMTLKSIGFTGKEVAGQVGTSFAEMGKQLGSAGAGGAALDQIMNKARDFSTLLGKMTIPALEALRNDPDAYNKGLKAIHDQLASMGAFETQDLAYQSYIANKIGLTPEVLQAFDRHIAKLKEMEEVAKKLGITTGEVAARMQALSQDPMAAIDRLSAAFDRAVKSVGGMVDAVGGSKTLNALAQAIDLWTKLSNTLGIPVLSVPTLMGAGVKAVYDKAQGKGPFAAGAEGGHGEEKPPPLTPEKQQQLDDELARRRMLKPPSARRAFAAGGEFRVPGSGASDSEEVSFMGTPGEKVTVSPKAADTRESLQQQQDKADIAMREHFARFRDKPDKSGAELISSLLKPDDRSGGAGSGFDKSGRFRGTGGDPAAGTRTGTGGAGGQASGTGGGGGPPGVSGVGGVPLNTPVGTDPASATGPAESIEEAIKRGYLKPPGSAASPGGGGAAAVDTDSRVLGGRLPTAAELADKSRPAGERFNNPFNMWHDKWATQQGGVDPKLQITQYDAPAAFPSKTAGAAAAIRKMVESPIYGGRKGGATIDQIIQTWVDPSGARAGYGPQAAAAAGVPGTTKMTREFIESAAGKKWLQYMSRLETKWQAGPPLTSDQMDRAVHAGLRKGAAPAGPGGVPGVGPGGVATAGPAGSSDSSISTSELKTALEGGAGADRSTMSDQDKWIASRYNGQGWTWKDDKAAAAAGISRDQYVVGGMDPRLRQAMYEQGVKYEKETGKKFEFTSGFRDDYRQSLITSGVRAPTGYSHHGGSKIDLGGTGQGGMKNYGYGGAFDSTPEFGAWIKRQGSGTGIAWTGEHISGDPYHVSGAWTREAAKFGVKMTPQQLAVLEERTKAARELEKTKVAGPAATSDVETRAAARYKAAVEGQAAPAAPAGPTFAQRARAGRAARAAATPSPTPVRRIPSAPGQEERAAGKNVSARQPGPRPVRPAGEEDKAAGKGIGPVEGLAEGGIAAAGRQYLVGERGPELLNMGGQSGVVHNRWPHMPQSTNIEDRRGAAFSEPAEPNEAQQFTQRAFGGQEGGLTDTLGGAQLDRTFVQSLNRMRDARRSMEAPIEPVIKPRMQMLGPSSLRWSRHTARQQQTDSSRQAARSSHTDSGFA